MHFPLSVLEQLNKAEKLTVASLFNQTEWIMLQLFVYNIPLFFSRCLWQLQVDREIN